MLYTHMVYAWQIHLYVYSPNTIKYHVVIVQDSLNHLPVVPSSDVMHTRCSRVSGVEGQRRVQVHLEYAHLHT